MKNSDPCAAKSTNGCSYPSPLMRLHRAHTTHARIARFHFTLKRYRGVSKVSISNGLPGWRASCSVVRTHPSDLDSSESLSR